MHCGLHNPPASTKKCKGCAHCFFLDALAILIAVTTAIKRRRRELVYSCGEIELLPPCTEAPPPWRGNPPFAGGGCARRREELTPRQKWKILLFAGTQRLAHPAPAKRGFFLFLRGLSASRRLAPPAPAKRGIPLHRGGSSVHGGRSSISLEYQIQPPAHLI